MLKITKSLARFFIVITSTLFSFYAVGQSASDIADPNAEVVKQSITTFMQQNNVPGVAVELYVNGKPYAYYFGYANPEKKIPVTKHTIFEIGSISKIMTSLLLAQEVDWAKMQLSDPIKKYMQGLPDSFNKMTLQDLATNTAGLPFNVPGNIKSLADLQRYLVQSASAYSPEEQWMYSNVGIGMLGYALENSTEKDYNKLYLRHILLPLKMKPIGLVVREDYMPFYAQGYDKNGKLVAPLKLGLFPATNGIKACADDMQRFLSAAIGLPGTPERIFYPMRMTQSVYVKMPDKLQGLGWQIHPIPSDSVVNLLSESSMSSQLTPDNINEIYKIPTFISGTLIDKTGGTDGFGAYIAVIPNKNAGIVILANRSTANSDIVRTGREILFKLTRGGWL